MAFAYLVLIGRPHAPRDGLEEARRRLTQAGWVQVARNISVELSVHQPTEAPLPVQLLGDGGVLIGRYHPAGGPACDALRAQADRLFRNGWGRYVAVRADPAGLDVVRDPSGGLDALIWETEHFRVVASDLPTGLEALLPANASLDWSALGRVLAHPTAAAWTACLSGLWSVAPGGTLHWGQGDPSRRQVWTPAQAAMRSGVSTSPEALREVVDRTVGALLSDHRRAIGEISGGFDSAVVATAAAATAPAVVGRWLNFHADAPEADERAYARAVARRAALRLEIVSKTPRALDADALEPAALGLRPGLQAIDAEYDAQAAGWLLADGADALLTGQGGDAVFFQYGTPALAIDRVRRRGLCGLTPRFLHQTARWTRWSAWRVADLALRDRLGLPLPSEAEATAESIPGETVHPWLVGLEALAPGKRGQVRQLTNCQVFWGDCRRARAAELLHPLLMQPVMEHGLGVPADILTAGGVDRSLARAAFADRLPVEVLTRRGKGELSGHYAQVVLASLPFARDLLIGGRLEQAGLVARGETEILLDPDVLIQDGAYNTVLVRLALELWVRRWSERLARRKPFA